MSNLRYIIYFLIFFVICLGFFFFSNNFFFKEIQLKKSDQNLSLTNGWMLIHGGQNRYSKFDINGYSLGNDSVILNGVKIGYILKKGSCSDYYINRSRDFDDAIAVFQTKGTFSSGNNVTWDDFCMDTHNNKTRFFITDTTKNKRSYEEIINPIRLIIPKALIHIKNKEKQDAFNDNLKKIREENIKNSWNIHD